MALLLPRRSLLLLLLLAVHAAAASASAALQLHFYARSCPRAEALVRRAVRRRAAHDRSVLPALIRLHFHDCFVRVRRLLLRCTSVHIFRRRLDLTVMPTTTTAPPGMRWLRAH